MKTQKLYSDLQTTEDFIKYYHDAGRRELKAVLKSLNNSYKGTQRERNHKDAIIALLV
jgi:hypothetical protein